MTRQWNDDCPTKAACPRAPVVKAIWQDSALHGVLRPEPNRQFLPTSDDAFTEKLTRPLITRTVQILAAAPGFYKLDIDDEHPHW